MSTDAYIASVIEHEPSAVRRLGGGTTVVRFEDFVVALNDLIEKVDSISPEDIILDRKRNYFFKWFTQQGFSVKDTSVAWCRWQQGLIRFPMPDLLLW
jgi:hypothetical protein